MLGFVIIGILYCILLCLKSTSTIITASGVLKDTALMIRPFHDDRRFRDYDSSLISDSTSATRDLTTAIRHKLIGWRF